MDSYLLPCLSDGRWLNFTSLSLAWEEPEGDIYGHSWSTTTTIAAESLVAIGTIESLQQLYLSTGQPRGPHHQWLIDHTVLRSSLGGLGKLKRLTFARDIYLVPGGVPLKYLAEYYEHKFLPPRSEDDTRVLVDQTPYYTAWERDHRTRMVQEADKYAALFPGLEWIYCGQLPMDIRDEQTSSGVLRSAVPFGQARDSCETLLRQMFSITEHRWTSPMLET